MFLPNALHPPPWADAGVANASPVASIAARATITTTRLTIVASLPVRHPEVGHPGHLITHTVREHKRCRDCAAAQSRHEVVGSSKTNQAKRRGCFGRPDPGRAGAHCANYCRHIGCAE